MNQSFFTMGGGGSTRFLGGIKRGGEKISFCQQSVKGDKCND